jgi:hypothetical protein
MYFCVHSEDFLSFALNCSLLNRAFNRMNSKKYLQNKQDGVFFFTLPQINPNCGFVIGYLLFPPLGKEG